MAKKERYEVKNAQGYSHQLLFTSDDLLEAKAFIAQYGKKANIRIKLFTETTKKK